MSSLVKRLAGELEGTPAAAIISGCFTNTWTTAMHWSAAFGPETAQDEVFVATGDIPAMWLRDSTAQVRPYLALADDPAVADALRGVLKRQLRYVMLDPYANSFNDGLTGTHGEESDLPAPGPVTWEQKYELDSLCAPLQLGYAIWRATGSTQHLDEGFFSVAKAIVAQLCLEQDHANSPYTFIRAEGDFSGDSLPNGGRGGPVAHTGMTWSGFRPSDDRCEYGYLIPSNALASASLHGLAELVRHVTHDEKFALECIALSTEIDAGIETFGTREHNGETIYAYEVDGLGGTTLGDDANLPSLLSLPLSGWCSDDDPVYQATRRFVLSDANPHYYSGTAASGVGSAHTPPHQIWPLAIATAGLTGEAGHVREALDLLSATTGGTGLMHESFHVDDPTIFTRHWFGWANAMFSELALEVAGLRVRDFFPKHPRAIA